MKKKKKSKRIKSLNGEIHLPEEVIHRIQCFMSGKEAARTTILSKSWYNAWLTRPTIVLDSQGFSNQDQSFEEFAKKTMQRYQDSSLNIESFTLRSSGDHPSDIICYRNLVEDAIKMGATDLQLELPRSFTLGQEVLGSETLLRLSVCDCEIEGNYISCPRLKSLSLKNVITRDSTISGCNSLEELSLSNCNRLALKKVNLNELHKLRRLFLDNVYVDGMVFTEFASRFPCLKDLTLLNCLRYKVDITSTSLQTIALKNPRYGGPGPTFDVPNVTKFTYSSSFLPYLSIEAASREWEFDITMSSNRLQKSTWILNLKKLLKKFRQSRISLTIKLERRMRLKKSEHEVDIEIVAEPLVVEGLMIVAPPTFRYALLLRLFVAFRPKFITLLRLADEQYSYFDALCKRLMHRVITPNCGIPDQGIFGLFGLKKVYMEKDYEEYEDGCIRGMKTRFELIWEDL